MNIEQAIRSRLIADADIVALIGERVYPASAPQRQARPYIVYGLDDEERAPRRHGNLVDGQLAFDLVADTYAAVKDLQHKVRRCLDTWRDNAVRRVTVEGITDQYEAPADGAEVGFHHVLIRCRAWYLED